MVTITDIAAEKAKEVLAAEGKAEWGIRVFLSGNSCCGPSFGMDLDEKAAADDHVIEHKGLKVFANKEAFETLDGKAIDFIDNGQAQGFVIKNLNDAPPPASSCGSGCKSCG